MSRRFWTDKDLKIEAKKFQSRIKFSRKSYGAYQAALRRGLMDEICVHISKFKWTQKTLTLEALKYPSRVAMYFGKYTVSLPQALHPLFSTRIPYNAKVQCQSFAVLVYGGIRIREEFLNV